MMMNNNNNMTDLPKEVVRRIFAFLGPKDFVRTSLLSRTWRNFWVSAPYHSMTTFKVNLRHLDPHCKGRSVDFLKQFLSRRRNASSTILQSLSIQLDSIHPPKTLITSMFYRPIVFINLLDVALQLNVRELRICLKESGCERDRNRSAGRAILNSGILSAPNLRTLELDNVEFPSRNTTNDLVISCPNLESLVLRDSFFMGFRVLRLCTCELKKLEVENWWSCELELNTPKLSSFLYKKDGQCLLDCSFGELDVLRNANSRFDRDIASTWLNGSRCKLPLDIASHARVLVKGQFQGLENFASSLRRLIDSYGNLKRSLELEGLNNFQAIAMLASFPSIEVLLLNFTHDDQNSYSGHEVKLELPPPCTLYNLKNVAARGIEGFECEHDFFAYLSDSGGEFRKNRYDGKWACHGT
ncbi:hypothetical protein Scep_028550 [Stephania cephalantha]|uniref:F-box domain-containing protein n=1 Tax=Stephania cephalantha TaxID=152367 RepID=A0AAP0EHH0_9MAGN